jgi:hypothetical protein
MVTSQFDPVHAIEAVMYLPGQGWLRPPVRVATGGQAQVRSGPGGNVLLVFLGDDGALYASSHRDPFRLGS